MDASVEIGERHWLIVATSTRVEQWLDNNFSCGGNYMIRSENGPMFLRAFDAEGFKTHVSTVDLILRDYDDQYSALLIARSERLAGRYDEAFARLAKLRSYVLLSDRRSATLLPEIDREIAAAHSMCRRDRSSSRGPKLVTGSRWKVTTWLRRTANMFDSTILRIAISIVLTVDLYKFVYGVA